MSDLAHPAPGRSDPGAAGALLSRLFEQHGRTVYGLCRLLLRDPNDAEDAAQQTFLSAYRALGSGVVPRDGGAWLATIARNECRNRVRARMREPLVLEAQLVAASESLDETAARSLQIAELKAALLDLPEKQREAVLLRDVYGLRYSEIAAALGATRPAVEALLFRARRRLQGRLRPLRDAAAALLVPAPLRDALAEAIPGFTVGGGAAGAAAGVTAAKLAAATLLVGTAGTTVAVVGSTERPHHAPAPPPASAAVADETALPPRDPSRRVAIAAAPMANRVHREPPRHSPKAHVARAATEVEGKHDEDDEEQDEKHRHSSGPGPSSGPSSHGRKRDADDEHEARSGPRAADDEHGDEDEEDRGGKGGGQKGGGDEGGGDEGGGDD
jgi:RNA polymerase sigma-70 factor (ECF subfamily)